jgi:hypothetical protein
MIELLKGPLDIGSARDGICASEQLIPGMDPLSDAIWKMKPDERKKRTLAFPLNQAGEIAGRPAPRPMPTARRPTFGLLLFVLGRPGIPSKDHARILDGQGLEGPSARRARIDRRPGFAESGARNWVHSAATVLAFAEGTGLLQPGYAFRPMQRDDVDDSLAVGKPKSSRTIAPDDSLNRSPGPAPRTVVENSCY